MPATGVTLYVLTSPGQTFDAPPETLIEPGRVITDLLIVDEAAPLVPQLLDAVTLTVPGLTKAAVIETAILAEPWPDTIVTPAGVIQL